MSELIMVVSLLIFGRACYNLGCIHGERAGVLRIKHCLAYMKGTDWGEKFSET